VEEVVEELINVISQHQEEELEDIEHLFLAELKQ
jgi:hypothetical protein